MASDACGCWRCVEAAERDRKRGPYWLTPEGRAELREVFDDANDVSCVRPLLDALDAAETDLASLRRERDALSARLGEAERWLLEREWDHNGRCLECGELFPHSTASQGAMGGHAPDCRLAAFLAAASGAQEGEGGT